MERLKKEFLPLVEENLTKYIDSHVEFILKVGRYILDAGGKRIRPLLTLGFAKAVGKEDITDVVPLSVALEYLHTASLLHDDVVDGAETRRGKPSANRVFGNETTVLTGDYMYATALYIFSTYGNIEMIKVVSDAVKKMAEGQLLELKKIADFDMTEQEYFQIIDGKTAVLFGACGYVGANSVVGDTEKSHLAYDYGIKIGRAFQIVDDILDYTSTSDKLGKPVCNDIKEGKITYPLIVIREKLSPEEREFFKQLVKKINPTDEEIQKARDIVLSKGGHKLAFEKAKEYVRKAINNLEQFPDNIYCRELKTLANYIVEREV
ncbi:MAG: polyprenyl synthetase family protein [Aquificae bacterium]|nr:polyprenyl synthetase family protein [Aquificota bacterium]